MFEMFKEYYQVLGLFTKQDVLDGVTTGFITQKECDEILNNN